MQLGNKYNRLTVVDFVHKNKKIYAVCQCNCGKVKTLRKDHVRSGVVKSCGRYNAEQASTRFKGKTPKTYLPDNLSAKKRVYKRYIFDAKRRNIEFGLTFEQFLTLALDNCYYCGEQPKSIYKGNGSKSTFIYNGIDRKNNEDYYSANNSVTCCTDCNFLKRDRTLDQFLDKVKRIYEHTNNRE